MNRKPYIVWLLILLTVSLPAQSAEEHDRADRLRIEIGALDYRLMMVLSQTAPLVQQFTGLTVSAGIPLARRQLWTGGALSWIAAVESGLSFDSTGVCRWTVRRIEQSTMNASNGIHESAPGLRAELFFGRPIGFPIRIRTEVELTLTPGWRIRAGVEGGIVLLFYAWDCAEILLDFGVTLGTYVSVTEGFGLGLRARVLRFGDAADGWPGFGATLYAGFSS